MQHEYVLVTACMRTVMFMVMFVIGKSILFQVYTRYGKCYTFNGNKTTSRKTKQGGMGNGLEIMLDIQQDEYLPIWRETSKPQNHLSNIIPSYATARDTPAGLYINKYKNNLHPFLRVMYCK